MGGVKLKNSTRIMSTGQCDLHHLCVVSSVFLIKFKNNLVLTFKQFRSNTRLHYLRFMRDKQGRKEKKKKKNSTRISACMSKFNKKFKFVTNLNSEVVSRISIGI